MRILICLLTVSFATWAEAKPPNVLLIMADDMGYSDLGCFGGEIETPHLDGLAQNGLRFTQFYNTARCWPTRATLLSGIYSNNLKTSQVTVAQVLKTAGYQTGMVGKWHLGNNPKKDGPIQRGFDDFYGTMTGAGSFWDPYTLARNTEFTQVDSKDYYYTDKIGSEAVQQIEAFARSDKPFFQYVAFAAPHFPLHALPEDIAPCRDRYTAGWDRIRAQRWQRVQKLGLVKGALPAVEREIGPPYHFPEHLKILGPAEVNRPLPWADLSNNQKKFQQAKMAIHAAMVERMDKEIGRILKQLRAMKSWENTLVIFLSDNGASAEIMVRADGHDPAAEAGSAATYLCLGPGWSTTCNTPFRRHKTWVHEGGCATPFIVHWPGGIPARNALRRTPAHVIDVAPTLLDLAGLTPQRRVPSPGRSLTGTFPSDEKPLHEELWWLHEGHRALRQGDWKLVAAKGDQWELFNLSKDRTETRDLAGSHPERVAAMEKRWNNLAESFRETLKDNR